MPKRFIDTGYFKSPFVRGLEAPLKLLYSFIICDCSPAGIWTVDIEVACLYCGMKITQEQASKAFIESGKAIDLNNGKWFFIGFLEHQYPQGLSNKNPAQKNLILELRSYGLIDEKLNIKTDVLFKGHQSPFEGTKETDKEEEEVIEKEEEKETKIEICPTFNDFWELYDKKVGKENSQLLWINLLQAEKETIMRYLPDYINSTPDIRFRKNPEKFLAQRSWNDEIIREKQNGKYQIRNPDGTVNYAEVNRSADEFLKQPGFGRKES